MTPKRATIMAVFLLFTVFVLQNAQPVEVRFLFWETTASRAVVLFATFCSGLIIGWLTRIRRKASPSVEEHQTETAAASEVR